MLSLLKRNRTILIGIAAFCFLLIALLWSNLLKQTDSDKEETIAAAVQRNSNLAVALEQYAIRTIQNADAVIQLVKKEYANTPNPDLSTFLKDSTVENDLFTSVSIVNERGTVIASTLPLPSDTAISVADREHFYYHQRNLGSGLYIGEPVISRTFKRAAIPITRRYLKSDGSFGGTITVQVEPTTFTRFYAEANLGPNDLFSLVAMNGTTYARRTGNLESYGENISKSPLYIHVAKTPIGNYFAKNAITGVPTFFSFRKLAQYGMIATVGSAKDDILAEYYKRSRREYISTGLISVLIVGFSILMCALLLMYKRNEQRVREKEAQYRSFFENSLDAILLTIPDGEVFAANPAATAIFGMSEEEICNSGRTGLVDLDSPNLQHLLDERQRTGKASGELIFKKKDGSRFTGEVTSAIYQDASGKDRCTMLIRDITEKKKLQQQLIEEQNQYQLKVTQQVIHAQEREREVIGRELHDNVNQVLTTVKLYLEMALTDKEAREKLLPKSIQHVMESINEIRKLSQDLSAPTLGTRSLIDSINALLEVIRSSSGLRITFRHHSYHITLPMEQKLAIYRIIQEQLNNVIKHAKAEKVLINLSQTPTTMLLSIKDNGKGFDTALTRNGIGINNIISRAKVFGGVVEIDSKPGMGCTLTVSLPMTSPAIS